MGVSMKRGDRFEILSTGNEVLKPELGFLSHKILELKEKVYDVDLKKYCYRSRFLGSKEDVFFYDCPRIITPKYVDLFERWNRYINKEGDPKYLCFIKSNKNVWLFTKKAYDAESGKLYSNGEYHYRVIARQLEVNEMPEKNSPYETAFVGVLCSLIAVIYSMCGIMM